MPNERPPRRVLILAGTAEARALCARVADRAVTARLAGRTGKACDLGVPTEVGGFGGEAGFRAAIGGYAAVLDATHPFAARISDRTARICAETGTPYLRLTRPPWPPEAGWIRHPDVTAAAAALPSGARVLLATGPGAIDPFLGRGLTLWCRRVDPAPAMAGVSWITALPGDETTESGLMRDLAVTHLVTKNSGGVLRGKLDAARALGLEIHMIDRPASAPGEETHDIDRAAAFVAAHADHRLP